MTIWGLAIFAFGLLSYDNVFALTKNQASTILLVGVSMTIANCGMTFFGSTSNNAAFNAMATDGTDSRNHCKAESFLSIIPLFANIAMLAIDLPLYVGSGAAGIPLQNAIDSGTPLFTVMAIP
jgi:hypothetical protein